MVQWRNDHLLSSPTSLIKKACTSLLAPPSSSCVPLYLPLNQPENSMVHSRQLNVDSLAS